VQIIELLICQDKIVSVDIQNGISYSRDNFQLNIIFVERKILILFIVQTAMMVIYYGEIVSTASDNLNWVIFQYMLQHGQLSLSFNVNSQKNPECTNKC